MFPIQDRFLNKLKPLFRASGWFSFGAYLLLGLGIALLLGHSAVVSSHVATYNGKDANGYDIIIEATDPWYERHTNYYRNTIDYIGIERYDW